VLGSAAGYCVDLFLLHAFVISALDGGEWTVSRIDCFTPMEIVPGTR
jgi:hypothetical protein